MSNQFENQNFDAYGSSLRSSNAYPEAFVVFPGIQAPALPENSEISHTRHFMDLLGAANESNHRQPQPQGLSLSLGSHMLVHSEDYRQPSLNQGLVSPNYFMSGEESREACNPGVDHLASDYSFTNTTFASSSTSLTHSLSTSYAVIIGNSRYLGPLQSLLEELVDVGGNVMGRINEKYVEKLFRGGKTGGRRLSSELRAELCNNGVLLAEKHELHVKIAKLIVLLDEVGHWSTVSQLYYLGIRMLFGLLSIISIHCSACFSGRG